MKRLLPLCALTIAFATHTTFAASSLDDLGGEPFAREVVRHLYRWYLDEADVDAQTDKTELPVWVRDVKPKLDDGDNSRFAEILFPSLGVSVSLKKTDYRIEELNLEVKSRGYRIINVARVKPPASADAYAVTRMSLPALREHLFTTRNQREYPDAALATRLRAAVKAELGDRAIAPINGEHICHVGPLSSVSNELWVYWENARTLVRFSSDLDLSNPATWTQERLTVKTYDVDKQAVLSFNEAPGSNAFLTRHQIGRVLYNCIVLGQRQTLAPSAPPKP
jgi:hypothetical protein